MMVYQFAYETEIGRVVIAEENGAITYLGLTDILADVEEETPLIREAYGQLLAYLAGEREDFDVPLAPKGTAFQKRVWDALRLIEYGGVRTYKEIAVAVGNEKASRAVGMANNRNPIFIMIPCHRVIGANGKLVGYGGGLPLKEKLLNLETKLGVHVEMQT